MTIDATSEEIQASCEGDLHSEALRGFELFDAREYWHAHEALEEAWLEEPGPIRHLYQGILQAGVVYLHVQRQNYRGVVKVHHRCRRWLDPFPAHCRGIDVGQLRADLDAVMEEVERLGPENLDKFDHTLLKPLAWVSGPAKDGGEESLPTT